MSGRWWCRVALVLAWSASSACGNAENTTPPPSVFDEAASMPRPVPAGRPVDNLPATFTGVLPCADCPGIDFTLDLMPDQTYALRRVYRDRPVTAYADELGRWALGSDGATLMLQSAGEPAFFEMVDHSTLRQLDRQARPIRTSANLDLRRQGTFRPLDLSIAARGAFAPGPGGGTFTECLTGRRWPVAAEGARAELERSHHTHRGATSAEPLVVRVLGRIAERERANGIGTEAAFVVDRVGEALPDERCSGTAVTVSLEDTDWRLIEVRGQAVAAVENRPQQPGLRLQSATRQFAGSGGCNRLIGSFQRDGAALRFSPSVTTRMACPVGLETEEALVAALDQVARWRILGRRLELIDAAGVVLARLEAR